MKLLLPAIIPSWKFFDTIAPSPRIEYALLATSTDAARQWQEFRPRPEKVSPATMLKRLLWNPRWNESLFLVSCAERLMDTPTEHSSNEILARIRAELAGGNASHVQFRLVFLILQGNEIQKHITFMSPVQPL